jgi:hypothetical protein
VNYRGIKFFLSIVLSLWICSCTNYNDNESTLFIDINTSDDTIFLSKIVDTVKYIPLETLEENYIQRAGKIRFFDNKFYVLSDSRLLIFDINGKFISQVNKKGRGPDEYLNISDFCISSRDSCLCLITRSGSYNIDKYSLYGDFIKRTPIEVFSLRAEIMGENLISFNDGEKEDCIDVIDLKTGRVINSFLKARGKVDRPMILNKGKYFDKSGENLYFSRAFSNTIYQIYSSGITPKYIIDFGSKNFPGKELRNVVLTDKNLEKYRNQYVLHTETYFINPKFLHFIYIDEGIKLGYYFFKSKELIVTSNYKNDFDDGFFPYRITGDEKNIYCLIDSWEILTYYKNEFGCLSDSLLGDLSRKNPFVQLCKDLDESDNPVVMMMKY